MLLAGGQGSRLKVLTEKTAKPAVPFGGKYRIIDFPLSNCVNSGIDTVGILTQYQPLELNEYIGNGQPWGLNKTHSCAQVLPPYERHDTVPVVHATGGLRDTVPPCDEHGNGGLGFTFQSYNGEDFYASLKTALNLYHHDRNSFRAIQRRGMEQDFSWTRPAQRYMELYTKMACNKAE